MSIPIPLIVRRSRLKEVVGIAPSSIDRMEAAGEFPRRRRFTVGIVGWSGEEITAWVQERVARKES
jgi:prophage regulatory protein